ncbi:CopD family protein [Mycolicibacterium sp. 050158]|uniref:CopD family protein n=1 Tax=Mycolicibacterium sp. 050158 TaxID=3090602 RepID=UPI00299EC7BE|nr:CopD family protein [Mycolicibacterium sp. 050158]MDX1889531.1 CopD family protein [Mycolicibacterium sp. 050158]
MNRLPAAILGALCVGVAAGVAWGLAYPQNALAPSLVRALSDGAAVAAFGLAIVPAYDVERYRGELGRRASRPLIVAAAVWVVAELVRLLVGAAEAAGASTGRVDVRTAVVFATDTAVGHAGVVCLGAAAVVCALAVAGAREGVRPASTLGVVVVGASAIGVGGRSLVGHLSESPWGGIAVAVHTLAAAIWCGSLAALVATVTHRGQWARVLPRFSQVSLGCVVVLLVFGVAGAAVTLGSPADLYATGYGRVLMAKILVTVVLVVLAARNRAAWLPAARSHRATATVSRVRSRVELAIMAMALTLAAALAVTG